LKRNHHEVEEVKKGGKKRPKEQKLIRLCGKNSDFLSA
jgi:hypothetical protein